MGALISPAAHFPTSVVISQGMDSITAAIFATATMTTLFSDSAWVTPHGAIAVITIPMEVTLIIIMIILIIITTTLTRTGMLTILPVPPFIIFIPQPMILQRTIPILQ